ncbi:nuclear transport factor 2 family protein [Altererythrobacter sp. GH1-8]|uniref:nuclear transport factor 2 family protein n=1 Tax=Altererythrobacter sp. GH1-8 TaxID=3349333 RepID=UPI00374DBA4B
MNQPEPYQSEIATRIDRIESRFAMQDLVSDYCHGFDKRDWDRFLAIWWPEAVWDIGPPFGKFEAHAGIEHVVKDILWPAWLASSHFTTNLVLTFDGADKASGVSDVDCIGTTADGQAQTVSASYFDRFERRKGIWKIAHRKVTMYHFSPLPGVTLSPPE